MPKHVTEQMDFRGLEILADEFTGTVNGEAGDMSVDVPAEPTWTTVNAALADIASRLAALEV